ncbi:MAG: 4-hydroxy-tetrahydrodipicolinate reductase [Chlamydiae bacterium]|nr:4-hydroxy-tetrahydrodipicolinate reductase [Chlamydiota bacterium]
MKATLGIHGITGRMGTYVLKLAKSQDFFSKIVGYAKNYDYSSTTYTACNTLSDFVKQSDVIIDFSLPEATLLLIEEAQKTKTPLIIGTTGFSATDLKKIEIASTSLPIVYSANFSIGIAACIKALESLSNILSNHFSLDIIETHHIHKKDAPSGTALALQKACGKPSQIQSIREGEVIGQHKVIFSNLNEKVELYHEAFSRETFAKGALHAAQRILDKPQGYYSLKDLLI